MKIKKMFVWLVAICVFGFGMAYADVDNPQIFVPVEAEVMEPSVTVTLNTNGLNFGQILPHLTDDRFVEIDVSGIATTASPAGAQTAADGATVDDTDATMASLIADPTVVLLSGTTRTPGGFVLLSDISASVTVAFVDRLTLTNGLETMTVSDIRDSSNVTGLVATPIALVGGTPQYVHIGGVLNVAGGQAGGTYTNSAGGLQVDIALQ